MDSGREGPESGSGWSIPVSWVVACATALIVVGASFYGGMAYERHQRDADLATVSGLDGTQRGKDSTRATVESEPLELRVDETVEVDGPDGDVMITLDSVGLGEEYPGDRRQRYVEIVVTLGNLTGGQTLLASLNGRFEDNLGQTREHVLSTCTEDLLLPPEPVPAGRFVTGCERMTVPDDAGRIVLDDFTPELYVEVPAD